MRRTRTVAAAPVRSASSTWEIISNLVVETVTVSPVCTKATVEAAMKIAAPVARMLIAGGHLDRLPLVLVAGAVHCEITTISGTPALKAEENLNVIPGASTAQTFMIHLPTPASIQSAVVDVASRHPNLSAEPPPELASDTPRNASLVDMDALRRAVGNR